MKHIKKQTKFKCKTCKNDIILLGTSEQTCPICKHVVEQEVKTVIEEKTNMKFIDLIKNMFFKK